MTDQFQNLETLYVKVDKAVAFVALNRPEARNAMNIKMVAEITAVFQALRDNRDVRAVVLSGVGKVFCAGGDIKEMREKPLPATESANNLDAMLRAVNQAPQVVIARIEGAALGGGFGLVCASDVAIASTTAKFGMPEVRLGIAPSFISPFVLQRIGLMRARELMLTGRRFGGEKAKEYGIVNEVYPPEEFDAGLEKVLEEVRQCGPNALAAVKELIFTVMDSPLDDTVEYRANLLNQLRVGEEAQEGLLAFIQKRPPGWAITDKGKTHD